MISKIRDISKILMFTLIACSFFLIVPPNAGSDELWSARVAWFLYENPKTLFSKSEISTYEFPGSLTIPNEKIGEGIPYPCFFENNLVPSSCQILQDDKNVSVGQFDRVFRSAPFYFFVGWAMHVSPIYNSYWSGKLAALLINCVLLFLSMLLMKRSGLHTDKIVQSFTISALPILTFSLGTISPIAFEVSCAYLFMSVLYYCLKKIQNFRYLHYSSALLSFSALLLSLSRPLGAIWGLMILLFMSIMLSRHKLIIINASTFLLLGLLIQTQIDNYTFRFGNGNQYLISPNLEFYFEESIRVVLNSGNWIKQIFGLWTYAGAPELPAIFMLVSFVSTIFIFYWEILSSAKRTALSMLTFIGMFGVPFLFSLLFAHQWPMWWSGRYQMPLLFPLLFLLTTRIAQNRRTILYFTSVFVSVVYLVVVFARFNWGLYPNGTPVMINKPSFSPTISITWALLTTTWLLFCIRLTSKNKV